MIRINVVWLILSVVTVVSWGLATDRGPSTVVTVAVLAIAAVKTWLIMTEFMETRVGPKWLRRLTGSWLVALLAGILALYLA